LSGPPPVKDPPPNRVYPRCPHPPFPMLPRWFSFSDDLLFSTPPFAHQSLATKSPRVLQACIITPSPIFSLPQHLLKPACGFFCSRCVPQLYPSSPFSRGCSTPGPPLITPNNPPHARFPSCAFGRSAPFLYKIKRCSLLTLFFALTLLYISPPSDSLPGVFFRFEPNLSCASPWEGVQHTLRSRPLSLDRTQTPRVPPLPSSTPPSTLRPLYLTFPFFCRTSPVSFALFSQHAMASYCHNRP